MTTRPMTTWIDVCGLDDIPPLGTRIFDTGDQKIALFRTAGDQVYALEDKCPHKGGQLSQGLVHGMSVTCPLHNQVINLNDGNVVAPDTGCVKTFGVKLEEARVLLDIEGCETSKDSSSKAAL